MKFAVVDGGEPGGSVDCVEEPLRDFASNRLTSDRIGVVPFERRKRNESDEQHHSNSAQHELRVEC